MQLGMVIDTKACLGCTSCAVKCKQANNLPNTIWWNRIIADSGRNEILNGTYPNNNLTYYPLACQHCANPACVKVCPVGATYKDPETGIVMQDYDKCVGCRMCMAACPYTGVRSFNWQEPAYYLDFALGEADAPKHQKQVVEKCMLCSNRVQRGLEPACIEICPGRARFFGDLDDPASEVSTLIATRTFVQLLPEKGTNPSVYYLV